MSPALRTPGDAPRAARSALRRVYLESRRWLTWLLVERRLGIETAKDESLSAFGLAAHGRGKYEPSSWLDLRRILRRSEVGPGDVFVDLGSGKGRIVLEAARYPFGRVIGVELSPELAAVAEQNLERMRPRLTCKDVQLVTSDVLAYEMPDDVTVAYIYNAFSEHVLAAAVNALIASYDRRPRRLRIIYRTPLEEQALLATGRIRALRRARGLRPGRAWSDRSSIRMYEVVPPA